MSFSHTRIYTAYSIVRVRNIYGSEQKMLRGKKKADFINLVFLMNVDLVHSCQTPTDIG